MKWKWVILTILLSPVFSTLVSLGNVAPGSYGGESTNQDKHDFPVIDEIFQACGPIFFQSGSSEMGDEGKRCLFEVRAMSHRAPNYYVVIDGHRDSLESKQTSIQRAKRARDYLVKQSKLDPSRIIVRDFGDSCPYEAEDVKFSRRVEFRYWREDKEIKSMPKFCAPGAKARYEIIE
jgi:outer membrane protein OmpA-like peptidoglycan-associated protein